MKAKYYIFLLLCWIASVEGNAQYFYHTYGNGANIPLTSAVSLQPTLLGPGTLQTGFAGFTIHVARTDAFGAIAGGLNNHYELRSPGNAPMPVTSVLVAESSAPEIMLFGTYISPNSQLEGIFCLRLDGAGAIMGSSFFTWMVPISGMTLNGVYGSGGNIFFVTGQGIEGSVVPQQKAIVIRFNAGGGTAWAFAYSEFGIISGTAGYDVEVFPVNNNVYVVGSYTGTIPLPSEGYVLQIDAATGNPINAMRYSAAGVNDRGYFTGITSSSPTPAAQGGLLISGTSNFRTLTDDDGWGVKILPNLNLARSTLYDYAPINLQNNYFNDVIERKRPNGVYNYYFTGWTAAGAMGLNDIHVVKTTDGLASLGHYTYGTPALDEQGRQSCLQDPTAANGGNGLFVFGTEYQTAANGDLLCVGAYFNGVSQCNFVSANAAEVNGPQNTVAVVPVNGNQLVLAPGSALFMQCVPDLVVCSAAAVAGGNNAKTTEGSDESITDFNIDIQALAGVSNLSAVTLTATGPVKATVEVTALTGQLIYRSEMDLGTTGRQLPNTGELPDGILVVRAIADNGVVTTKKVLLQ